MQRVKEILAIVEIQGGGVRGSKGAERRKAGEEGDDARGEDEECGWWPRGR